MPHALRLFRAVSVAEALRRTRLPRRVELLPPLP